MVLAEQKNVVIAWVKKTTDAVDGARGDDDGMCE